MRRRRRATLNLIHLPLTPDDTPPDPAAVNAIDGFDDLPRSIRDVLNYGNVNMIESARQDPHNPPCRTLVSIVAQYGETAIRVRLAAALNDTSTLDARRQNRQRS
jgi:hypothetical protein